MRNNRFMSRITNGINMSSLTDKVISYLDTEDLITSILDDLDFDVLAQKIAESIQDKISEEISDYIIDDIADEISSNIDIDDVIEKLL